MIKPIWSVILWSLVGSVIFFIGMFCYRYYIFLATGQSLMGISVPSLLFEVMELDFFAAIGAYLFGMLRILTHFPKMLRWAFGRTIASSTHSELPYFDIDRKIKEIRKERAEEYLKTRKKRDISLRLRKL